MTGMRRATAAAGATPTWLLLAPAPAEDEVQREVRVAQVEIRHSIARARGRQVREVDRSPPWPHYAAEGIPVRDAFGEELREHLDGDAGGQRGGRAQHGTEGLRIL